MVSTIHRDHLEQIIATQSMIVQADFDLGRFMQLVVDTLQGLTQAKGAVVELVEGEFMRYRCASGAMAEFAGFQIKRDGSLSGLCVSTGQVLRCDDSETDPRVDRDACRRVGVRSMVCTPLMEGAQPVGVLKVMSERPDGFTEADVEILRLMAGALGAALSKQLAFDAMAQAEARARRSESRLSTLWEYASDAVICMNAKGIVTQWNRAAQELFGWSTKEAQGRQLADLVLPVHQRKMFLDWIAECESENELRGWNHRKEVTLVNRELEGLWVQASLSMVRIEGELELTALIHDISDRKAMEDSLREMALTDGLTRLLNRRGFMANLESAVARARRHGHPMALFYMDLNDFKQINDVHGHQWGDEALSEFARRLRSATRKSDQLARLGGDEFTLLAEGIGSENEAMALAHKIVDSLIPALDGRPIQLKTSIGISLYQPGSTAQQFLVDADHAMYQAKNRKGATSNIWLHQKADVMPMSASRSSV